MFTGLDIPKHGEPAYPLSAYGHGWATDASDVERNGPNGTNGRSHTHDAPVHINKGKCNLMVSDAINGNSF